MKKINEFANLIADLAGKSNMRDELSRVCKKINYQDSLMVKDVMTKALGREPEENDYKDFERVLYRGETWYDLKYQGRILGRFNKTLKADEGVMLLEFTPAE